MQSDNYQQFLANQDELDQLSYPIMGLGDEGAASSSALAIQVFHNPPVKVGPQERHAATPSWPTDFFVPAPCPNDVGYAGDETGPTGFTGYSQHSTGITEVPDLTATDGALFSGSVGHSAATSGPGFAFGSFNAVATEYNDFGGQLVPAGVAGVPFDDNPYVPFNVPGGNVVFNSSNTGNFGKNFGNYASIDVANEFDYSDMNAGFDNGFVPDINQMDPQHNAFGHSATPSNASWNHNNTLGQVSMPAPMPQLPATQTQAPASTTLHSCNTPGCTKRFKRLADLTRHRNTVHLNADHLCPIAWCPKARRGAGYRRSDKVTEHLWKKHADLGFTKA